MSKPKSIVIHHGKNIQSVRPQHWHSTNAPRVPQIGLDEFKYGFPSDGLSVISNKWWRSSSEDTNDDTSGNEGEKPHEHERKTEDSVDLGGNVDGQGAEIGNNESNIDPRGAGLLLHLRKKAAKEGKEALKLGVYRGFDVSRVGMKEKKLLLRIFRSSLPSNCKTGSFES